MTLGLALEEGRAIAVGVEGDGTVAARAVVDAAEGDLAAAADRALEQVGAGEANPGLLGLATAIPDAPPVAAVVSALAPRFEGPFRRHGAMPSGTAAAVAEAWIGAGRGVQDLVYFGCGDHTVGGTVRGGVAVGGARGRATSVAWLALNPVEREDYRKIGCLEAEVAAPGIVRRLIWRIKAGDRSHVLDAVAGDFAAITVRHVLDAARQRDGVSISVMRDTAKYLGMAAANLVAVADPELLVLGGIMASAADLLLDPLRTEIARRLPKPMFDALRIETARLGEDAAAIGAARHASVALP
ncbi:MAG TPA: ROK family protein [Vicinamibacterales bacterium]|nr:ROK family protein [Vicinamibacterales bacterium]